jgi:hypothetical protein
MSQVFLMRHNGILCALPATQVMEVNANDELGATLELWPIHRTPEYARNALVRTGQGVRTMKCVQPRLTQFKAQDVFALPALLDRALTKPFVVGLARIDAGWAWLVDLEQI